MSQQQPFKKALLLGLLALGAGACQAQAADDGVRVKADGTEVRVKSNDDDSRIESSAKNSYVFKTYLKDDSVSVHSVDGSVTLTGTVDQDSHRTLAQDTVADLPGVKNVDNQIKLKGEAPSKSSDAWITAQVKTALLFHKNVSGMHTEVSTNDGVVTLAGKADSEAQKQLTEEYAKDIEGVKEVRNTMIVARPEPKDSDTKVVVVDRDSPPKEKSASLGDAIDDASITAQAKLTLLTHRSTSAIRTKVTTRDGVVMVSGEAKNGAEKELVSKLINDIDGVRRVENSMTVQTN